MNTAKRIVSNMCGVTLYYYVYIHFHIHDYIHIQGLLFANKIFLSAIRKCVYYELFSKKYLSGSSKVLSSLSSSLVSASLQTDKSLAGS